LGKFSLRGHTSKSKYLFPDRAPLLLCLKRLVPLLKNKRFFRGKEEEEHDPRAEIRP
jgi:hypothetical protein